MTAPLRRALLAVAVLLLAAGGLWSNAPATWADDVPAGTPITAAPATAPSGGVSGPSGGGGGLATYLPSGANVAIVKISGEIDDFQLVSLRYRCHRAIKDGASLIVIELDTPGGQLYPALKMSAFIKALGVPTVAWVNDQAYSAGTLLAAACRLIVMSPSSNLGDCAPITPGWSLAPTERAKALSPLLEDFRDSAQKNQYDFALFHAMCELHVELYQVRNRQTGAVRLVNQADYHVMVEGASPRDEKPPGLASDPQTQSEISPVGMLVATEADKGQWELVDKVHDGRSSLLALAQSRATAIGLCKDVVRDDSELRSKLGAASIKRYDQWWLEVVAYWLTQGWVRAILVMVMMIGAYAEFHAPGTAAGGIAAGVALLALFGAPYFLDFAEFWHIVVFAIGAVLLALELFVFPTFGALAIVGLILMFVGLVLAVVPSSGGGMGLPTAEGLVRLQWSVIWMLLGLAGGGAVFYILSQYFGSIPFFNRLILRNPRPVPPAGAINTAAGASRYGAVSGDEALGGGSLAVGEEGVVLSELRPTGRARFGTRMADVMSQGDWIEPGQRVRVVEVQGNRIIVAPAE